MIVFAKVVGMILLGGVTLALGIVPLIGVRRGWFPWIGQSQSVLTTRLLSALGCFGGGVILTSCLTHMLPDVNEVLADAIHKGNFPDSGLPVAEILVLAGFLLLYMVEELVHLALVKYTNDNDNNKPEKGQEMTSGGGGHGHSHDVTDHTDLGSGIQATARGFMVILALSIHDLFEGIALGVARRESSVWFLVLAFASHKWVISACLGLNWGKSKMSLGVGALYLTTFCMVSPIGVGVGMALTSKAGEDDLVGNSLIVLQGLATGSLLYVVFFEIMEKERKKPVPGIIQVIALSMGLVFMVLLGLAEVASERNEELAASLAVQHLNSSIT